MRKNKSEKQVLKEVARITSMKEDLDAISWSRVAEIAKSMQESADPEARQELGRELLSIAQANASLLGKFGTSASQSGRVMPSGIEILEDSSVLSEDEVSATVSPSEQSAALFEIADDIEEAQLPKSFSLETPSAQADHGATPIGSVSVSLADLLRESAPAPVPESRAEPKPFVYRQDSTPEPSQAAEARPQPEPVPSYESESDSDLFTAAGLEPAYRQKSASRPQPLTVPGFGPRSRPRPPISDLLETEFDFDLDEPSASWAMPPETAASTQAPLQEAVQPGTEATAPSQRVDVDELVKAFRSKAARVAPEATKTRPSVDEMLKRIAAEGAAVPSRDSVSNGSAGDGGISARASISDIPAVIGLAQAADASAAAKAPATPHRPIEPAPGAKVGQTVPMPGYAAEGDRTEKEDLAPVTISSIAAAASVISEPLAPAPSLSEAVNQASPFFIIDAAQEDFIPRGENAEERVVSKPAFNPSFAAPPVIAASTVVPETASPSASVAFSGAPAVDPSNVSPALSDVAASLQRAIVPEQGADRQEQSGYGKEKKPKSKDFARFRQLYASKDGGLSLYEDSYGHLVAVDSSKLV